MPDKMIDRYDRLADRVVKFFVILILVLLYLFFAWWLMTPPPERRLPVQPTEAEKRYIEKRHKHHGIYSSVFDRETGEMYFMRNGKRRKL
jgi:hypothetical protein